MENKTNVYSFKTKQALFSCQLREEIADGVLCYAKNEEAAAEIVDRVEDILCRNVVRYATDVGSRLGKALGDAIASKFN